MRNPSLTPIRSSDEFFRFFILSSFTFIVFSLFPIFPVLTTRAKDAFSTVNAGFHIGVNTAGENQKHDGRNDDDGDLVFLRGGKLNEGMKSEVIKIVHTEKLRLVAIYTLGWHEIALRIQ